MRGLQVFGLVLILLSSPVGLWLFLAPRLAYPGEEGGLLLAEGKPLVVEFSSWGCPYCRRYGQEVFPLLFRRLLEDGGGYRVHFLDLYPGDRVLNALAYCAYREGGREAFLAFRKGVLEGYADLPLGRKEGVNERELEERLLVLDLATPSLLECAEEDWVAERGKADLEAARRAWVSATPTLFLGRVRLVGLHPLASYLEAWDRARR